jgi:hypothetical protein
MSYADPNRLLKSGQVADGLGLGRFRVIRLNRFGRLSARRVGHDCFVRRADSPARPRTAMAVGMGRPIAGDGIPPYDD